MRWELPSRTAAPQGWTTHGRRALVHRTTYGAEFHRVDELDKGDDILIETAWGRFNYSVTRQAIVEPDSRAIVVPSESPELVLTTCNPKYSAAQRLIVYAELEPA